MNRRTLLDHGTQMRQCVLTVYRHYPTDDAAAITRQMVFEVGQAFGDMHSRADAAAMMYSAADAITCKMPMEDFRLLLTAPPPEEQKIIDPPFAKKTLAGKVGHITGLVARFAISWQFIVGYWLGFWMWRLG